jgi:preprotein translocase subunit SecG
MAILEGILWVIFTLLCILVSGVILLQEGKGGGLGEAFGGAGQQTFGVKAGGIAKFTGGSAAALVILALAISCIRSGSSVITDIGPQPTPGGETGGTSAPVEPGAGAPAAPAGGAPAAPDQGDGN